MSSVLYDTLLATMQRVCRKSLQTHAGEQFYCVALYTSVDYAYIVDSLATDRGLRIMAERYLEDPRWKERWVSVDNAMRELRWSPCDSPWHCEFSAEFDAVQDVLDSIWADVDMESESEVLSTCDEIYNHCLNVLNSIRDSGLFDRDRVIFNILQGDQDDVSRVLSAEKLNSGDSLAAFRRELGCDETSLEARRTAEILSRQLH